MHLDLRPLPGGILYGLEKEREAYCKAHGIDSKAKGIAVKISGT